MHPRWFLQFHASEANLQAAQVRALWEEQGKQEEVKESSFVVQYGHEWMDLLLLKKVQLFGHPLVSILENQGSLTTK